MSQTTDETCRACGGVLGDVFYEANDVPVHSCLLLSSAAQAEEFPTGQVRLAPCLNCGTVTNIEFDGKWSAYSPEYEDQQHFSPTFNSFAGRLAQGLVERHDLRGQTVIDIGCSKGDFLALLCDAGASLGIGIDPSVVEGRVAPPKHGRLELIGEYYSDHHLNLPARLLSCRHTLEHVHDVQGFLRRMHRHAATSGDAVTFIEVPSLTRVLTGGAFEDVYYEHCSYFTPGALARALRAAGFGVRKLWLDYDGQYLLAEAVTDPDEGREFDIEEPVEDVLEMVRRFKGKTEAVLAQWRGLVHRVWQENGKLAIWGSGSKCIAFWHAVQLQKEDMTIVDINPNRWGKYPPSVPKEIQAPDDLPSSPPDTVIVMNAIYRDEIAASLKELGVKARVLALGDDLGALAFSSVFGEKKDLRRHREPQPALDMPDA